jgi:hypothetical protein
MSTRTIHLCLSVTGALRWDRATMKRNASMFTVDGRRLKTADEVRDFLIGELAQGHEVLPCAECDNFDWKTGCKGHPAKEDGNV